MQVSDMRALRAIYTPQRLLKPKSLPNPSLISFKDSTFSRHFHSSTQLRLPEPPNSTAGEESRPLWSVLSPARKASIRSDGGESGSEDEMGPSSLVNGVSEIEKGKGDRSVGKVKSGSGSVSGGLKNGKGKVKTSWVCSDCGETHGQWMGKCRSCFKFNTLKRFSERNDDGKVSGIGVSEKVRSWLPRGEAQPVRLTDVNRGISWKDRRIPLHGTFGSEVGTVLGGGIVPGSLIFIGGDAGVGKSTLVLQIAALIAEGELGKASSVVYVSGEESIEQIGSRADRMGIETDDLFLYSSTDTEDIISKVQSIAPQALIVDSIQTVYIEGAAGSAGGIVQALAMTPFKIKIMIENAEIWQFYMWQVKECTSALLAFAKRTNIPVFLIGHVNKSGEIAGPRVLEHIVDVVLYMEGEKHSSYRLLRSVKNRFGSTDELGVFEMSQSGLEAVSNPGGMFLGEQLSDSEFLAGIAVAVVMDGSRSFLIEIQALCVSGQAILQQVNGIQASRASMIISVLAKQAGLKLQENAIFLNVVSGVTLKETAGDLAIAAAICSSFLESPIPNSTAFIGEIGPCGELCPVSAMDKRVHTLAKLGYKMCIVPKSAEKSLRGTPGFENIEIIGCKNLKEVINNVFRSN